MATRGRANLIWMAAWLATLVAVAVLLVAARRQVIARLDNPQARAQWQSWQADVASGKSGPVQRRVPRGDEPPALVIMRDNFPGVLVGSLLISSCLIGFLMLALRGALADASTRTNIDSAREASRESSAPPPSGA